MAELALPKETGGLVKQKQKERMGDEEVYLCVILFIQSRSTAPMKKSDTRSFMSGIWQEIL